MNCHTASCSCGVSDRTTSARVSAPILCPQLGVYRAVSTARQFESTAGMAERILRFVENSRTTYRKVWLPSLRTFPTSALKLGPSSNPWTCIVLGMIGAGYDARPIWAPSLDNVSNLGARRVEWK